MPRPADGALPLRHAAALGLLHGPAELLPVSSSGHTELVPWLLRWPYAELDPELRKAFEVALHAGTGAALLVALRDEVGEAAAGLDRRRLALIAGSVVPPALAARFFERRIEREASSPGAIALGLLAGSLAMVAAEAATRRSAAAPIRSSAGSMSALPSPRSGSVAGPTGLDSGSMAGPTVGRARSAAGLTDGLALGVAQAAALWPGVSRNGATVVAARLRGFSREDANVLSRHVALPVIAGATGLKGWRLARRGLPPRMAAAFATGTAAAFASTLACARLVRTVDRGHSLLPYAAYRTALAALTIRRLASSQAGPARPRIRSGSTVSPPSRARGIRSGSTVSPPSQARGIRSGSAVSPPSRARGIRSLRQNRRR